MGAIRNIEQLVITRRPLQKPEDSDPLIRMIISANVGIRDRLEGIDGKITHMNFQRAGHHPEFQQLKITSYPSLVFTDMDRNMVLWKLSGRDVRREKIQEVMLSLNRLQESGDGTLTEADGSSFLPVGWGSGLKLPNFLFWGLAAYGGLKAIDANNNTSRILWGAVTAAAVSKAKSK